MSNDALLLKQLSALLSTETDAIANAANLSALLFQNLTDVNWLGFYFLRDDALVLGPFQGQPACTRLPLDAGVCAAAFTDNVAMKVDDVHSFAGHIVCDAASRSECVVPFSAGPLRGVLDIDSPVAARFSDADVAFFQQAVNIYQATLASA